MWEIKILRQVWPAHYPFKSPVLLGCDAVVLWKDTNVSEVHAATSSGWNILPQLINMASQPRRSGLISSPPWKPQISHAHCSFFYTLRARNAPEKTTTQKMSSLLLFRDVITHLTQACIYKNSVDVKTWLCNYSEITMSSVSNVCISNWQQNLHSVCFYAGGYKTHVNYSVS